MLTAAHVQRGCTHLEATLADQVFPVFHQKSSDLLDVAVLKSNRKTPRKLPLRSGQVIELGEFVTSVGYPLQSILATSATITRGNISAEGGIQGSFGLFQFSAPIQPGNSGGPIVSDNGELLGMAVSTLSAESLSKRGLIPQNVNFALNAKYIAAFLSREKIAFNEIQPKTPGEMRIANEAALSTTAKLSCYQ
jgi:S1-C subfamily serine protease